MSKIKNTPLKGSGVFAEKSYEKGEIVIVGVIEKELPANHSHASQVGLNRFVLHNEICRMVNHSCEPNCGIRTNVTGAQNIVARQTIGAGDEITYDYAMGNYGIEHFPFPCNCGSEKCRKKITGWKDLSDDKKEEYNEWADSYLLAVDKI